MHHHQKYALLPKSDGSSTVRSRSVFGSRLPNPSSSSTNIGFHGNSSSAHVSNGSLLGPANGHTASPPNSSTSASGSWIAASSTIENSSNNGFEQSQNFCCYHYSTQERQCPHSGVSSTSVMINGSNPIPQTIEDQIRAVDKVIKDCDNSRKNLDQISRRLDELNDEVKRYRDFLGHEKSRRDPALYKTVNSEPPSPYNDHICGIMSNLTFQLTKEWNDKLGNISSSLHLQTPSTPSSKMSERN